jgi:hypothetical protein
MATETISTILLPYLIVFAGKFFINALNLRNIIFLTGSKYIPVAKGQVVRGKVLRRT